MVTAKRALLAQIVMLTLMGSSTTLLTGCPSDECPDYPLQNPNIDCEDEDEDGFCAVCCASVMADGSLCRADCDDTDPWTNPNAPDLHVDGLDSNCDNIDGPVPAPPQEICGNGIDDDGNGLADCSDAVCASACIPDDQRTCNAAVVIADGTTVTLDLTSALDALSNCGSGEVVVRFDAAQPGELLLTPSQTLLFTSMRTCQPNGGICNEVVAGTAFELAVEIGSTYIVIESNTNIASFVLSAAFTPHLCGDGIVTGSESCDDGGTNVGDGCDASCALEPYFDTCVQAPPLSEGVTALDAAVDAGLVETNMVSSTCGPVATPEYLHVFTPPADGTLTVALENAPLAALYVRKVCAVDPLDLGCDVADETAPALLHIPAQADVPLFVFVDGADLAQSGATLTTLFNAHD